MKNDFRKNTSYLVRLAAPLILLMYISFAGFTQSVPKRLTVGDPAPPLVYSCWIKGNPDSGFPPGKIFVLEFWATWCGPCIAAMPHLSELAIRYQDKVKVIAVNAGENTGARPYSSCIPMVRAFVEKNAGNMNFDVILDNDARGMTKNWLTMARISGIPATIVIKDNIIQWIGHPQNLQSVLEELLTGGYDLEKTKRGYEESMNAKITIQDIYQKNIARIDSAIGSGNYRTAIAIAEESAKNDVRHASRYGRKKLAILISHHSDDEVLKFLENTEKEDYSLALSYANYINQQPGLNIKYYKTATGIVERWAQKVNRVLREGKSQQ